MTHEDAINLIKRHTGYMGPQHDDTVQAIAAHMARTGEGVWHAASVVTGRACRCFSCTQGV